MAIKSVRDYPIKYVFGYSKAYGGYHTGVDRPCPSGTPLIINNTTVGYSGNTGYSTGPHHHLSKHGLTGKLVNPKNTGFRMASFIGRRPVVYEVGEDSRNGKYIRVRAITGRTYIHCHLSKITCKVGDKIK